MNPQRFQTDRSLTIRTLTCPARLAAMALAVAVVTGCTTTEMTRDQMPLHGEMEQHLLDGEQDAVARRVRLKETRSGTRFDQGSEKSDERKADHVVRGDEAWAEGDGDLALYEYVRALVLDPGDTSLYVKVAQLHEERGNHKLATTALRKAVDLDPTLVPALERLGLIELKRRNYAEARHLLQRAIDSDQQRLARQYGAGESAAPSVDPASPHRAHTGLGIIEDLEGNHAAALAHYQQALVFNPLSALAANNIGYSLYLAGKLDEAEAYFERAIKLDTMLEKAWYNRALLWVQRGHIDRAVSALASFNGDEASAHNTVGYICMVQGKFAQAEALFAKAIDLSPSYFALAYQNRERNRYLSSRGHVSAEQVN